MCPGKDATKSSIAYRNYSWAKLQQLFNTESGSHYQHTENNYNSATECIVYMFRAMTV